MLSVASELTPAPAELLVVDDVAVVKACSDEVAVPAILAVLLIRLRMPAK